jgi:peptidoglycan/xylan/chitin deacetylase (PgdA/CDA1 family)
LSGEIEPGDPVLMYHGVSPERSRRFRRFVQTPEGFEEQMTYLADNDFRVCSVSEFVARRRPGRSEETGRLVALTFDDAFRELLMYAVPILDRFDFGATIYVPTAYIGASSRWLEGVGEGDRPVLRAGELRELSSAGIECGAHSHTHAALDVLPVDAARAEVELSKQILEEVLGREVRTYAYPFGYASSTVRSLVAGAGYKSACRVNYGMSPENEDVYALSRLPVAAGCRLETFVALVSGQASLRRERARARAWRPVRREIGRLRRLRRGLSNG